MPANEEPSLVGAKGPAWTVTLLALVLALLVGTLFSALIYDNSIAGIVTLAAEFAGALLLLLLLSLPWRRHRYTFAVVIGIAAFAIYSGNMKGLLEFIAVPETRKIMQDVRDPAQMEKVAEQHASNKLVQLIAEAQRAAQESIRLGAKLDNEIEPPGLALDIRPEAASRAQLEAFRRDLATAKANAEAFMPPFLYILKAERARVDSFARSLDLTEDTLRSLLAGIDKRHAKGTEFTSRMMSARARLYGALDGVYVVLIAEQGRFQVQANGQYLFASQAVLNRYNAAAGAASAALKRVEELEEERKQLEREQQEGWRRFGGQ